MPSLEELTGVISARITGGGFDGCTVNIVRNDSIDDFISNIERKYEGKYGITPDFYVVEMGDGARRLS